MISFWTSTDTSRGISDYRRNRGQAIAARIRPRSYEEIDATVRMSSGPQIFAALDQLSADQRAVVTALWDRHAEAFPSVPRLNDPRRVLLRFELLAKLHREGINEFRVYRPAEAADIQRFPVFIRDTARHNGPLTRLLQSTRELVSALRVLRLRGHRLRDLMVVEFCDTSDDDNAFRKYAAYKLGDTILPWHLMVSKEWNVKSAWNQLDAAAVHEGIEYCERNPHIAWLSRVFAIAGVDYGRIDYGMIDGRPQVWEINLNPSVGGRAGVSRHSSLPEELRVVRESNRETFHARLRAAFLALEEVTETRAEIETETVVEIDPSLIKPFRSAIGRRRRRRRLSEWLHRVHEHRWLGVPLRVMSRQLPGRPKWIPRS